MRLSMLSLFLIVLIAVACTPSVPTQAPLATQVDILPTLPPLENTPLPLPTTPIEIPITSTPEAHTVTATPEPIQTAGDYSLAFVSQDGNVYVIPPGGTAIMVTQDAVGWSTGVSDPEQTIQYSSPRWSTDGNLLAYVREISTKAASGRDYQYDLMVYDRAASQSRVILPGQQILGHAWKPGTHLVAVGSPIDIEFFMNKDTSKVKGIIQVDADTGAVSDLVLPERELPLVNPVWSDDGSLLAFDEVYLMEGRGKFAYYDFTQGKYNAWDEPIGGYAISPDNLKIAYDNLVYTPIGSEKIVVKPLEGGDEKVLSKNKEPDYAFSPVYSPDGNQIAYFESTGGPESQAYNLMVVAASGGEPRQLSHILSPLSLIWAPDGSSLIYSRGLPSDSVIVETNASTGVSSEIGLGSQPAVTPN